VNDDSEIDWKTLSTADWNFWSAHTLQRRWITLKRGVKGYEDMTHQGAQFWINMCYFASPISSRNLGDPQTQETQST